MDKFQKKLITQLKNHKMTAKELGEELHHVPEYIEEEIENLMNSYIDVDITRQKKGKELLYHINMLPDIGNVYNISGKEKKDDHMKFGEASDIHFASKFHLPDTFHEALNITEDNGVTKVYIPGDIHDGVDIYRGHRENLVTTSIEEQTDIAAEALSKHPNLEFWGIAGNHDYSFTKKDGSKPLAILEAKVDNFKNLGDLRADVIYKGIKIRLLHGGSGRAYARSYPTQTYLRDLFGGSEKHDIRNMPDILLVGHYHTKYQSKDHGIEVVQPGSFQDGDNEYCIRKGLTGPNGLYEVEFDFNDGIIDTFQTKYIQPRIAMKEKGRAFAKTSRNYRS